MFYFKGTRKPDFTKIEKIDYDRYWIDRGFELRSKLLEREQIFFQWIPPRSSVLDIGCGNSRLLFDLKTRKQCAVEGWDTSGLVVSGQRQAGIEAGKVDLEGPGFSVSKRYDFAVLSEVLEHLREPEELIKKLLPFVSNFVISVPNTAFYRYRFGLMFKGRFPTQWARHPSEHLRYWSHKDFLDWLKALNLQVAAINPSNGFWFKSVWPNLFGHQICYLVKNQRPGSKSI